MRCESWGGDEATPLRDARSPACPLAGDEATTFESAGALLRGRGRTRLSCAALVIAVGIAVGIPIASPGLARAQTCHHGVVDGDTIVWETRSAAVGLLSQVTHLESIEGGVLERGAIRSHGSTTVRLRTRQSFDGALRPPLVRGPQRITLSSAGGEPVAFEPRVDGPIERHVGYATTAGLDRAARRRLDASCGEAAGVPLYVQAEHPLELEGALSRPSERRQTLIWLGAVLLVVAGVGGAVAYRRLRDRAAVEEADALLEERYRALDPERE